MTAPSILIVDDQKSLRCLLRQFFQEQGYRVSLAANGEEALEQARLSPPDLVLLDVRMPVMDGLETLPRLKSLHSEQKIIMISAFADGDQMEEFRRQGACDFIMKPFDLDELHRRVKQALAGAAPAPAWDLYVITGRDLAGGRPLLDVAAAALAGGARILQLREKDLPAAELVRLGLELRRLTRAYQAALIVNDRVDVALAVEADGAHVGQDDLPAAVARRLLGPGKILGVSAATVAEAQQAQADGADYLGVGAIFATGSKADAGAPVGPERISAIKAAVRLPVVAIGGITAGNAGQAIAAGADGVAVISAVVGAPDVRLAAAELLAAVRRAKAMPRG